jgi:hypothetical protein
MKNFGAGTNFEDDWKLITIQIGSKYKSIPILILNLM